jgi:hypothetical protein
MKPETNLEVARTSYVQQHTTYDEEMKMEVNLD